MSGPDTRASSELKMGLKAIDATGSHQNGKHLLGSSPGGEVALEEKAYDSEEEAMMKDVLAEELEKEVEASGESAMCHLRRCSGPKLDGQAKTVGSCISVLVILLSSITMWRPLAQVLASS